MSQTFKAMIIGAVLMWLAFVLIMLSGCASYHEKLRSIPHAEFDSFEYHRGGNFSSCDIVATGCSLKDGVLTTDSVSVTENWGPFFSLNVSLKGYKRQIKDFVAVPE